MKCIWFLVVAFPSLAFATNQASEWPIDPAHAVDQATITSLSLQEEFEQFKALAQWQNASDQYQAVSVKFEQAKLDFERAKTLRRSGTITESKFAEAFYASRTLEADMIRLPQEIIKAKITAQFHKLRLLEEGNPNSDHRAELAQALVDGIQLEVQTLASSLALAKSAQALAQSFLMHGKQLAATKAISASEFEHRTLIAHSADIQVDDIEKQIAIAKLAASSFQTSVNRLTTRLHP